MKTQHKIITILFGVMLLSIAIFLSCVDIPSKGPDPLPAIAAYRFVHAATDLGEVGLSVDGVAKGNLSFKGIIPHQEYTAGTRTVILSKVGGNDTLNVAMDTDFRGTFCILNEQEGTRAILRLQERRSFDSGSTGAVGALRVVHLGADTGALEFSAVADTVEIAWEAMEYGDIGIYAGVPPGEYRIYGVSGADTLLNYGIGVQQTRTTALVVGTEGALEVLQIID